MIREALTEAGFNVENTDFDLSVAKGAAIFGQGELPAPEFSNADADAASGDSGSKSLSGVGLRRTVVTNVLSRGLGVCLARKVGKDEYDKYIYFLAHANETLPLSTSLDAGILYDGQSKVSVDLYEQGGETETEEPEANKAMVSGPSTTITGLPYLHAHDPIDITLEVSTEGVATLVVVEPQSGKSFKAEAAVSVLTQEEVNKAKQQIALITTRS